jgi:alpha-glucosidase
MNRSKLFFLSLLILTISQQMFPQAMIDGTDFRIYSPDGNFTFRFYQKQTSEGKKQMYYTVDFKNKHIIFESELGLKIDNRLFESALAIPNDKSELWCENLNLKNTLNITVDKTWKPLYGERSTITDHYNELTIDFEKNSETEVKAQEQAADKNLLQYDRRRNYKLSLVIRAYNEGVAFRYFIPENTNGLFMHITGEQTQFALPEGTMGYYERWSQGPYSLLPLKNWPDESERPLTLKLSNGLNVALAEAEMIDYSRGKFKLNTEKANTLQLSMYDCADVITPFGTPWRVIMVAETPGKLIENNDLIQNLNPENKLSDTGWIKPGKAIRDMTCSMEGAMACVDFAALHHLQYVHLDAGWYGSEMKVASDAGKVTATKNIDMKKLVDYAAGKNIGIFIYVNQRALANQIDTIFPLYEKWGIKGVKFGFVQVGSNKWTFWLHEAVRKAAKYHLMVDIHDEYRPTGYSRTYPNLMTQEGIRGNEEMPEATHNCTLPFTRYLAGAGDYTVSYYSPRIKNTHAHQLALSVICYSPIQFLYWYDKPDVYTGEPEIEFFDKVKTVWDDTKVLAGAIGEYVITARRSENDWFIGAITNTEARKMVLSFDFIEANKKYIAHFYIDDETVQTRTKVKLQKYIVTSEDMLTLSLKASGGAAVYLEPAMANDLKVYMRLPKSLSLQSGQKTPLE